MTDAKTIDNDGERMVPEFHRPSLMYSEHVNRYLAATEVVRGKRVLDIASGSGYGSQLLAGSAASVIGVDVSADAVAYASTEHSRSNLEFRVGDAERIPVDDASVDVVVTFETIEHVADYERFVAEIDRVLAPGGVALVSTPNDLEFIEGNHFHLHEFVYDELMELVSRHFSFVRPYFQATWKAVAIGTQEAFSTEGPVDMQVTNLAPLERDQYLYFYLVCAREPVDLEIPAQLALGGHYSDRQNQQADLAMIAAADALTARIREVEAERDALAQDVATITATRGYRFSRSLASVAHRFGHRPGA
ncbi:class I SAM-dependent methyltransferase [Cellulomonas sp. ICMP 17802]|uniref:class I SAM-dependent methyltransferase n=1 Tax=Cellulomonas sp. ICMP 17802 TaxID=3239199 RepID=UPI00351AD735